MTTIHRCLPDGSSYELAASAPGVTSLTVLGEQAIQAAPTVDPDPGRCPPGTGYLSEKWARS